MDSGLMTEFQILRQKTVEHLGDTQTRTPQENFRRIERREWWLWAASAIVTLLLTVGLASFIVPGSHQEADSPNSLPQTIRGLVGLVFLFDLYAIYQHLLIHRIRRRLVEREELFHLISENAADMIAVVDMEGNRLFNSLSYRTVLGYSAEELQASTALEQIHPEDRDSVRKAAEEARVSGVGKRLEYRLRHKNGEWLVLESTSSVICDSAGKPEKLVIVNRNITERKRAEDSLRRSEAAFRAVVEDAPYGIYRVSTTGRFLQMNPALRKMLGYESTDELRGKELETGVFQHASEYQRLTESLTLLEEIKDVEVEWRRRDGAPITVRCSGRRRINVGSGLTEYFEMFAEDVTEKRVLEKQLRMAQKMEAIGRLSGGIAHDFNNHLCVIIGYSRVLTKALGANRPLCEHALEIEKAGERAASLIKQLLAFSRLQVLTPAILNLNTLATDMESMLPRLLGEDIEVSLTLNPELGAVEADRSQIEQIIMNLAVNARDAMPTGGKLKIRTANVEFDETYTRTHPGSRAGKYVLLAVIDTGTGMDVATLAHIFEPFFTTKEVGKGTGLGLATVYGIVKQSDGYIWVDSALARGTSFEIYLPEHVGQPAVEEPDANTTVEKLHGCESILLVEDAQPLRRLAQTSLETAGFHVLSAGSGKEALDLVAGTGAAFDLLLTDVVMPGMSGRALAEQLSSLQPGLKVLYMSGYTDSLIAEHAVLGPGIHLLHKPFTEEVLIRMARQVLDGGEKQVPASQLRE
jgi:PAS domain S-box-containing protein